MGRPATLKIDIVADAKGVGKGVDEAEGKLGKLGKLGGPIAAGLAVGVGALVAFGASAVGAASRAEQAMGAVESVFGSASGAVKAFAEDSALRLGLAKSEYMDLAAVVGSQLQNMGRSQAEASVETDQLISLGADLAATFGGSVSDAVGAVGSLLRGERDPIERYGIAIKDADIQARLAADGNDKLTGAARKTAEATATLTLLNEQAAGSLGAFAREGDTLAGTQERLKARFEDVKAELGAKLLPVVTAFGQYLLTEGVPALERFGGWIVANKDSFITFGATIGQVLLLAGQAIALVAADFLKGSADLIGHLGTVVTYILSWADSILGAASAAFGWIPGVGEKIDGARGKLATFGETATAKLAAVQSSLQGASDKAAGAAGAMGNLAAKVGALRDKTVTVTTRIITVGGGGGGLSGGLREFAADTLGGYGPQLTGGYGSGLGPGGLTTAALGDGPALSSGSGGLVGGVAVLVDRRVIDARVTITGALDPVAVARQLDSVQRSQAVRLGAVATLPGSS